MAATKKSRYRAILSFLVYLILLGNFLFFAESMGRQNHGEEYRYNIILFQEIKRFIYHADILGIKAVIVNVIGNVVVFMPFGYFVPRISKRAVGVITTVLFSFEFSLLIEIMQLISKKGTFDVDDLFLNTVGGFLGYLAYIIIHKCIQNRHQRHNKKLQEKK